MTVPARPQLYHILHVDRLASVLEQGGLWSDAETRRRGLGGTDIGMSRIKERRLRAPLTSRPGLHVGDCVPFYFCPRSVMLYLLHRGNHPDLAYAEGQGPILHLRADLRRVVAWAEGERRRWAFTTRNAGSRSCEDWRDLALLDRIDWEAVRATSWARPALKEGKQAEFLLESFFPWRLVEEVAAQNRRSMTRALALLDGHEHKPPVLTRPEWYY